MTELEMYELWLTLREWANYNQLNQTIEKNWLSNSFNSHILDLLDKEEIKYRSEKRLLGYRNKGKRRLAGNANQPIIINIDDVADVIDVRAEDEFARVELLVSLKQELEPRHSDNAMTGLKACITDDTRCAVSKIIRTGRERLRIMQGRPGTGRADLYRGAS